MSHAVKIDYEGISIQCQSICRLACDQLCQLDRMLEEIDRCSSKLLDHQTEALRNEIAAAKQELQNKIDSVLRRAKKNAEMGRITVDTENMGKHSDAHSVIEEAAELRQLADRLSDTKIMEYEALLDQLMSGRLASHQEKLKALALGTTRIDTALLERINSISDGIMRQYVYLAWAEEPNANFDKLCAAAARRKEEADNGHYSGSESRKLSEIKSRLKKEKIDGETIEKIVNQNGVTAKERIRKATELAHSEIVSENIRHESVKIIVMAIKKRGFYVDNRSIKIDRKNDTVHIIAQKPSGAKAEFKVYLDGRFEYRFDGYEGQSCQKDIQPFMKDLEDVYGIKAVKQTELWRNPDKTSSVKQQTVNSKKGGG